MAKQKLDKTLSVKFAEYVKLREEAKEVTNKLNREKTVLKNIFKDGIKNRQFVVGTYIQHNGFQFDYNQTATDIIEPEDFVSLWESGQITKEQFLKCISVQKGAVDTHVGSDVTLSLSKTKTGKDFDIRIKELDIDTPKESVIVIPDTKNAPLARRKPVRKPVAVAAAKPTIRRIRIKPKK